MAEIYPFGMDRGIGVLLFFCLAGIAVASQNFSEKLSRYLGKYINFIMYNYSSIKAELQGD